MDRKRLALVLLAAIGLALLLARTAGRSAAGGDVLERESEGSEPTAGPGSLDREAQNEPERSVIRGGDRADVPENPAEASQRTGEILEVRVSSDGEPVSGAAVELVPFDDARGFLIGAEYDSIPARAATDADGLARFEGRPPETYGLSASTPGGATGRTRIQLTPDSRIARVQIPLGTAALEGNVHDLDGGAAAEALVVARQNARRDETPIWFAAKTDAAGNYRLAGIAGGPGRAIVASVLDLPLGDSAPFEIAPGETRRLDFGSPDGRARWSGIVRIASGRILPGPARLYFTAQANETSASGYFDEQGRFEVVLPSGEYTAHVDGPKGPVLGRAEVSGAIVQDLVVPRIVLYGRIRYVGTKHPVAKGPEHDALVTLERSDGAPMRPGFLHVDSRYAWFGLEPGSYVVTTSPWIVAGSADGRATIELGAGTDELLLDLEITDP